MADGAGDNGSAAPDGLYHHYRYVPTATVTAAIAEGSHPTLTPRKTVATTEATNRLSPASDAAAAAAVAAAMATPSRPLPTLPITHSTLAVLPPQPPPLPTSTISTMLPPPPRDPYVSTAPSTPPATVQQSSSAATAAANAAAANAAAAIAAQNPQIYPGNKRKQRTSGVWQYFEHFTPLTPGGRNVRCMIVVDVPAQTALGLPARTMRCGATYTHVEAGGGKGGSGTSGMLNHIANKHPEIYNSMMQANPHLTKSPKIRKPEGKKKKLKASLPTVLKGSPTSGTSTAAPISITSNPSKPRTQLHELSPWAMDIRSFVIMCALNSLDPRSIANNVGFQMFAETLSPACTTRGWPTTTTTEELRPSPVDECLSELWSSSRGIVVKALAAQHDSCRRLGWGGPLVALQVEVSGEQREGFEFCTASVAFVSEDFKGLSRLAVAARCFRGKVTSATTEAWIREVTSDLFTEICGESEPKRVYLAATVGGNGSQNNSAVKDALRELGIPVVACFGSRLHMVVMRSLGKDCAGSIEEVDDDGQNVNPKMREIVDKTRAMIEAFEVWPSRDAQDSDLESMRGEIEKLLVVLERTRLTGASWVDHHATLERLLLLMDPLEAYFRSNPVVSPLVSSDWQAIREAVSILDPAVEVAASLGSDPASRAACLDQEHQGQAKDVKPAEGVSIAEAINLFANLNQSFVFPTQDIRVGADRDGPLVSKQVEDLTPEAKLQLDILAKGMEQSGLGRARDDVESISMVLHPRLKACSQSACVDGGGELKTRALAAINAQLRKFQGGGGSELDPSTPSSAFGQGGSVPGATKLSRLDKMRQMNDLTLGASAGISDSGAGGLNGGVGGGTSSALVGSAADATRELWEYMAESSETSPAAGRGLLPFWRLHGTDTLDSGTGSVVLSARWPHLGLVARLFAGVEAASRQEERHFGGGECNGGGICVAVNAMRSVMPPWRVEQMVLLRLNQHMLPEIEAFCSGRRDKQTGTATG